jgi:transposase
MKYQLAKNLALGANSCEGCLEKQREIDRLQEENHRLKVQLGQRQRRAGEGPFGSSTPSSKIANKANTTEEKSEKKGGGVTGHIGHGRSRIKDEEATRIETVVAGEECPNCGGELRHKGWRQRSVLECRPVVIEKLLYRVERKYCERCQQSVTAEVPGVLPYSQFGNQLIAHVLVSHYLQGEPLGRVAERLGINIGSLIDVAHRIGKLSVGAIEELSEQYRRAGVRHADETSWRTDGHNGYAWLFATEDLSIYLFRPTRSAAVAKEILGNKPLGGVLVVDRYNAYNRAPCNLQYCYAHLMREVEDLAKEFAEEGEVERFCSSLIPLLAQAMHLRTQAISDPKYYKLARQIKAQIEAVVNSPARHLGIRRIQDIFVEKASRLYHWVEDRRVPAENNRAERELRPTVIARKVSFGSQSEAGAKTREILLSVLATLRKRTQNPAQRLKEVLDQVAANPEADVVKLLFSPNTS